MALGPPPAFLKPASGPAEGAAAPVAGTEAGLPEAELLETLILPDPLPLDVPEHKDGFAASLALSRLDAAGREAATPVLALLQGRLRALRDKAAARARPPAD